MNKERQLNAKNQGEFLYDYVHDILTFKIKDRDYKMSVELQNFVIDIDKENFVTGIRIFDVTKVSGLNKILFKNLVHGEFNASIKDNVITVRLNFVGKLRNRLMPIFSREEKFTQQVSAAVNPKYPMEDSVVCVPEIIS